MVRVMMNSWRTTSSVRLGEHTVLNVINKGFTVFASKPNYRNSDEVDKYRLGKSTSKSKSKTNTNTRKDVGIQFKFSANKSKSSMNSKGFSVCFGANIKDCGYINDVHKAYDECETGIWWDTLLQANIDEELFIYNSRGYLSDEEPEDILRDLYNPPSSITENKRPRKYIWTNFNFTNHIMNDLNLLNLCASKSLFSSCYILVVSYAGIELYIPVVQNELLIPDGKILASRCIDDTYELIDIVLRSGLPLIDETTEYAGTDYLCTELNCIYLDKLVKDNPNSYVSVSVQNSAVEYLISLHDFSSIFEDMQGKELSSISINNIEFHSGPDSDSDNIPVSAYVKMLQDLHSNLTYPDDVYKRYISDME